MTPTMITCTMNTAPKDGTTILLHYKYLGGSKWEECFFVNPDRWSTVEHWEPWSGRRGIRSTQHIPEEDTIEWLPVPIKEGVRKWQAEP